MRKTIIGFAAATFLLAGPAAAAGSHSWRVGSDSIHVYYSDLDMNTRDGRSAMLRRIERAANKLCDLRVRADAAACIADTLAAAIKQPGGSALRLALRERDAVRVAGR